jgi:hypothetical protein
MPARIVGKKKIAAELTISTDPGIEKGNNALTIVQ